jgi:hypothetical protein
MNVLHTAAVFANEEAGHVAGPNPYLFGGFALGALILLLIITMMIKVGD